MFIEATKYFKKLSKETKVLSVFVIVFPFSVNALFVASIKDIAKHPYMLKSPKKLLKSNYGYEYVLTSELVQARDWIKKYKIKDYTVSQQLKDDSYNYQRLVESNFPTLPNMSAEFVFMLKIEEVKKQCSEIEQNRVFKLVKC